MISRRHALIGVYSVAGAVLVIVFVALVYSTITDWRRSVTDDHAHDEEPEQAAIIEKNGERLLEIKTGDGGTEYFDITKHGVSLEGFLESGLRPGFYPEAGELRFEPASEAIKEAGDTLAVMISIGGERKLYPLEFLRAYGVINDSCGDIEIALIWDLLTGSVKVFGRVLSGRPEAVAFLPLGIVHNSSLLFCDGETRSIWSPYLGKCLAGEMTGERLAEYPFRLMMLNKVDPDLGAMILANEMDEGYVERIRVFNQYIMNFEAPFPMSGWDGARSRYSWSERALGYESEGSAKLYPLSELRRVEEILTDSVGEDEIVVVIENGDPRASYITNSQGEMVLYSYSLFFALKARFPDAEIYRTPLPEE